MRVYLFYLFSFLEFDTRVKSNPQEYRFHPIIHVVSKDPLELASTDNLPVLPELFRDSFYAVLN